MAKSVNGFIAKVKDKNIGSINKIATKLAEKGCMIESILPVIGVISGSAPENTDPVNLKIEGIEHIELNKNIKTK